MSGTRAISTTSRRKLSSRFSFLQGKALKGIHAILTLACFLPGRANDLSAPQYECMKYTVQQNSVVNLCARRTMIVPRNIVWPPGFVRTAGPL